MKKKLRLNVRHLFCLVALYGLLCMGWLFTYIFFSLLHVHQRVGVCVCVCVSYVFLIWHPRCRKEERVEGGADADATRKPVQIIL